MKCCQLINLDMPMKRAYSSTINITDSDSIFDSQMYKEIANSDDVYNDFPQICDFKDEYIPLKLYRYRTPNEYMDDVLSGSVRFSSPTDFNDKLEIPMNTNITKKYLDGQRNTMRKQTQYSDEELKHMTNNIRQLAVIACFSERPNNSFMWYYYASKHTGFCIEYDTSLIYKMRDVTIFRDDTIWGETEAHAGKAHLMSLFPVIYSDNTYFPWELPAWKDTHIGYKKLPYLHQTDLLRKLVPAFVVKTLEWKEEKEWRMIYSSEMFRNSGLFKPDRNDCLNLAPSITKVILGTDASEQTKERVQNRAISMKYSVSIMMKDDDTNTLKEVELYRP